MNRAAVICLIVAAALALVAMQPGPAISASCYQTGTASWYGPNFHGRTAASGETYNQNAMTAAHKTLPFGTKVKVTNQKTGKSVTVRITDRGPYYGGRIIDLSKAAARKLGIIQAGTGKVCLTRL
jgi:rare lipoprotein A